MAGTRALDASLLQFPLLNTASAIFVQKTIGRTQTPSAPTLFAGDGGPQWLEMGHIELGQRIQAAR